MLRPLGDRLVVEKIESPAERMTQGGVVLPETTREQSDRGTVLAVGPDVATERVSEGDTVVFSPYAGSLVTVDMESFLVVKVGDILGVIEPA